MQPQSSAEKARAVVDLLLKGDYAAALANSTPQMASAVTPAQLGQVMAGVNSSGAVCEIGVPDAKAMGGYDTVVVPVTCEKSAFNLIVSYDGAGRLAGLFIRPAAPNAGTKPSKPPGEIARSIVDALLKGDYAIVLSNATPDMKKALPGDALKQATAQFSSFGAVKEILTPEVAPAGGIDVVTVPVIFEKFAVNIQISLNRAGELAGLFFRPRTDTSAAWTPPPYSKPGAFRAEDVTIGAGEWQLPGTLLIPAGKGPFPGLVLVHGSGPNDRDETVGGAKVFRDIAEGLASRGIAVLRYDKRTRVYGAKMAALKDATVKEETIDDAVAAAALLRGHPEVDPRRVFLLGHSLGGYLAPRIGERDPKLAGIIIMAGNTRPMEDLIVDQTAYIASLGKGAGTKQIEEVKRVAEQIRNAKPGETIMGVSAAYWLDLKDYHPAEEARSLKMPLFIVQGERDYQVTLDDFAGWKKALENRATFKTYPALNHLFEEGEGKSTPQEYLKPGHVSERFIDDVAAWIAAH